MTLSTGLTGKVLAYAGEPIADKDGIEIGIYHESNDGGGVIPKVDDGYYYVSNSEQGNYPVDFDIAMDDADSMYRAGFPANLTGGAYSLEFNEDHELIGYKQILGNTGGNCAGGVTLWGSWVSCEERREFGRCWQTDPAGDIEAAPTYVTGPRGIKDYGYWEAMAWDVIEKKAYVTDDDKPMEGLPQFRGAAIQYTPDKAAMEYLDANTDEGKWCTLDSGSHAYLKLNTCEDEEGAFDWVADLDRANPEMYAGSERGHVENGILTFATIIDKLIFRLN